MAEGFTEHAFQTADGLRLQVRDYRVPGDGARAPALCLHGLTRNVRDFDELAPMIAGLGRRVIVASQRGRGGSDRDPNPDRYNPGVYAMDMLALLDQLKIEKAVYVGTSMGGLMTMITAAAAPQRLAGAVLNDIGPELDPAGLERIRGYAGAAKIATSWRAAAAMTRAINGPAFPTEESEAFWLGFARKLFRETSPGVIELDYDPAIARTVAPESQDAANLWPFFEALTPIPTLIVRGAISDILMTSTLAEMQRRKPDLQTASVPDVGHAPFMTEPAAWEALRTFLTAVP